MRKLIFLAIMTLSNLSALAYDTKIDGIYYNFLEDEAEVTYRDKDFNSYSGSVDIPVTVTHDDRTYSVTSIGNDAFRGCSGLASVTIPESVTSIGNYAFYDCGGLASVIIPESVTSISEGSFAGCGSLSSITIPNSVTSIGYYAFSGCNGMTSITIPESVTSISEGAFAGCSGLISVTISNGVTNIGHSTFYGCSGLTSIIIPEGVTEIDGSAFEGCSSLTAVILPNSLTIIGRRLGRTFKDCTALTSIVIPESVIAINGSAFEGCSALTSITIPNNMARIYSNTFSGCSSLTSISIPSNVTRIDNNAFSGCYFAKDSLINKTSLEDSNNWGAIVCDEETNEGLLIKDKNILKCRCWATSVTIPHSIMSIESNAFIGCSELTSITIPNSVTSIGGNAFYGCSGLTSITIPDSVTSIDYCAFNGCSGLTSITIPGSVTSIGDLAFSGCSGLTSIKVVSENSKYDSRNNCNSIIETATNTLIVGCQNTVIPNSVTSISGYAFSDCSGLTSITIPESVTNIGSNAFSGCKLHNILVKGEMPPAIEENAFTNQTFYHAMLYIPTGSWDAYAYDENWYRFINIRETAISEEQLSMQQAYTLMDASTFTYSVYDPVNDCIGTISSVSGINEDNPNHSWQVIEAGGARYLYNIGAKKYVRRSGNGLDLTETPEPIEVEDGDNGIILGGQQSKQWALVSNERMSVAQSAIDEVTAIASPLGETGKGVIYNLAGQRIHTPQKGLNIIGGRKVLIK